MRCFVLRSGARCGCPLASIAVGGRWGRFGLRSCVVSAPVFGLGYGSAEEYVESAGDDGGEYG